MEELFGLLSLIVVAVFKILISTPIQLLQQDLIMLSFSVQIWA